jgi:hypothetical protein
VKYVISITVTSSGGIFTIDTSGPADFLWAENPVVNRVIIQSGPLRDALSELEWWGNSLQLMMSPNAPHMQIMSNGDHGSCAISFPADCEIFDEYRCREMRAEVYKSQWIQCVFKALSLSEKACLRMNSNGMLSVQLMIRDESPVTTFVEFLLCADGA